jgi:osmotically-inducible protein OsmY
LHDPLVQGLQVGVDTFKGTVQLNGFVDTPEEKARAEQLAAQVPGVQTVQNKLTVKTNAAR